MRILFLVFFMLFQLASRAQELYIFTEPASNMATRSIGLRVNNMIMPMTYGNRTAYRLDPEIMWGVNKKLMLHANAYASNMMQEQFRFEGGSVYGKYRFLSRDDIHKHFRMAAFGKISMINNPFTETHVRKHQVPDGNGGYMEHEILVPHSSDEQNLDGNQSGWQMGLIATQLVNKLAVSATASHITRWDNLGGNKYTGEANGALQTSLSAGYLLFPKKYEHYNQTNMNLYAELLSQKLYNMPGYFVDAGPGIQFIFKSICRLDLGYRFQLAGNMNRFNSSSGWFVLSIIG